MIQGGDRVAKITQSTSTSIDLRIIGVRVQVSTQNTRSTKIVIAQKILRVEYKYSKNTPRYSIFEKPINILLLEWQRCFVHYYYLIIWNPLGFFLISFIYIFCYNKQIKIGYYFVHKVILPTSRHSMNSLDLITGATAIP